MSVRARLRGLLAAAALVCAAAAPAVADVEVRVDVGHGGRWVADCATVVNVTLRNTGAEAVGVTLALSQKESLSTGPIRHARIAYLGAGATRREPFVIPAPASYDGGLRIDVETEPSVPIVHAGRVASRGRMGIEVQATASVARTMISASGRVIGVVGVAAWLLLQSYTSATWRSPRSPSRASTRWS